MNNPLNNHNQFINNPEHITYFLKSIHITAVMF